MIKPGLERIAQLVKNAEYPWKAIHVAGTNGKGSICQYASSLLTQRNIRTGKFTSPHLVDRWDCISIDGQVVEENLFRKIEAYYTQLNLKENINASSFEILTATAFHIFTESNVDIGVVEVGMGGALDATNILDNQVISIIAKIARDHEGFLGNTLEEIARHKAGILRPRIPYAINPSNEQNVKDVVTQHARDIGAGTERTTVGANMLELFKMPHWQRLECTLLPFQRDNILLAVLAAKTATKALKTTFHNDKLSKHLIKVPTPPGRQQYIKVPPVFGEASRREILVDGAHNPDAARELRAVVQNLRFAMQSDESAVRAAQPPQGWPITWVLAMTEGKDASEYLKHLLEAGDNIVVTAFGPVDGMPWVKPTDPKSLFKVARSLHRGIKGVIVPEVDPLRALFAAKAFSDTDGPIVLTGSLYLVGEFHRALRAWEEKKKRGEVEPEEDIALLREMKEVQDEERHRVNRLLSYPRAIASISAKDSHSQEGPEGTRERRRKLQLQLEAINQEIELLTNKKKNRDVASQDTRASAQNKVLVEPLGSTGGFAQSSKGLSTWGSSRRLLEKNQQEYRSGRRVSKS